MPRGPAPGGLRLTGRQQVRAGIQSRFDGIPDIHCGDESHWTCGDRGVSESMVRGTQVTREQIEVRGCDLFEFTDARTGGELDSVVPWCGSSPTRMLTSG
jgi:hypothetical protein